MFKLHCICIIVCFHSCGSISQDKPIKYERRQIEAARFVKGSLLGQYYPIDSIAAVEIQNWRGKHLLHQSEMKSFKRDMESYVYDGPYAHTKPGHLMCKIVFEDRTFLSFYSNAEAEIIISTGPVNDHTFTSKRKINFDNY